MRRMFCALASLALPVACIANNIQLSNVTLSPKSTDAALISFDISWENSWRLNNLNHDAAWVFFKITADGTNYVHAKLYASEAGERLNPTGWSRGTDAPADLILPSDRIGVFVRRAAEGSGVFCVTNVQVLWDFRSSGFESAGSIVKVAAHAVEMVYVPKGTYEFGMAQNDLISNYSRNEDATAQPVPWTKITTGDPTAPGGYPEGYMPTTNSWPNGYNAFYCMKYEMERGLWCAFYNSLTEKQRNLHNTSTNLLHGKISVVNDKLSLEWPWKPMGSLIILNDGAFADWAGLRFMTEMEFVKACRGPLPAVSREFVWGTTNFRILPLTGGIQNPGTAMEQSTNGNVSVRRDNSEPTLSVTKIIRCGGFASAGSTREESGATYWGIMEMSGNLLERLINFSSPEGKAYSGEHGDGVLTADGYNDVPTWPMGARNKTDKGTGFFGGAFTLYVDLARLATRIYATTGNEKACADYGFRAVRSAPLCAATNELSGDE